ncbi:response regulator [Methylocaldum sp. MU1018]
MPARILVIEDDPDSMELMVYLLEAHGHAALTARDGETGLTTAYRERPDLVVCDIDLPGLDGYGVIRELKRRADLRAIPVVAVTALAMTGDRENVLAAGFDGYIAKPIDPESFVERVESFSREEPRSARPRRSDSPPPRRGNSH